MCIILYLYRAHAELPLVIAANRDEYYARPADPPRLLHERPRALGGVDRRAGGTWLGCNEHGLFVGLTNQRTFRAPDPSARSRGEVVNAALTARGADEVIEQLGRLDPAHYNAFNLLFGSGAGLYAAYSRPELARIEIAAAPEGVHALPNDRIGAAGFPRAERARALALPLRAHAWPQLQHELGRILADHERPPLSQVPEPPPHASIDRLHLYRSGSICTHGDVYGTCSASMLAFSERGLQSYLYADGPPCRTPFVEVGHLLAR